MRKIRFKLLTQIQIATLETEARTFGELKEAVQADKELSKLITFGTKEVIDADTKYKETLKFIERASRTEYGKIDEASLPVGDCLFFVTPTRTKSGAHLPTKEEVSSMTYKELRTAGSALNVENNANITLTGSKGDILKSFKKYLKSLTTTKTEVKEVVEEVDFKSLLRQAISLIEKALVIGRKVQLIEPVELAIEGITFEQLELEAEAIRTQLS